MRYLLLLFLLIFSITAHAGVVMGTFDIKKFDCDPSLISVMLISTDFDQKHTVNPNLKGVFKIEVAEQKSFTGTLIISSSTTFRIDIEQISVAQGDTLILHNIPLINSLRKKLPKGAMCGNFAPHKREIPKRREITINTKRYKMRRNWEQQRYELFL